MKRHSHTCVICENPCYYFGHLLNKKVYHIYCYQRILKNIKNLEKEIVSLKNEIDFLDQKLQSASLFKNSFKRIVLQKSDNLGSLHPRIVCLTRDLKKVIDSKKIYDKIINYLYDYWPALPPDWTERCQQVVLAQKKCHSCDREADGFYITHKIQISKGGDHKLENLMLLCEMCASVYTHKIPQQKKEAMFYTLSA